MTMIVLIIITEFVPRRTAGAKPKSGGATAPRAPTRAVEVVFKEPSFLGFKNLKISSQKSEF